MSRRSARPRRTTRRSRVRHRHAVPRRVEGLPRQRGAARHRGGRVRAAHHEGRQPRRARVLRADPQRPRANSSRASAARTTASRAASTASTTDDCTSRTCASPREPAERYGTVAEDGTYSSPIASPGRRFFTMLGTLVQGRVSLDGAATSAAAMALTIAITYGNQRRQFNAGERHRRGGAARLPAAPAPPAPEARDHVRADLRARRVPREVRRGVLAARPTPTTTARTSRRSQPRSSRSPHGTRSRRCRRPARPAAAPASSPRIAWSASGRTSTST